VSFVSNKEEFMQAILYAQAASNSDIIVEDFISGTEISVETISFEGRHYVVQITDKVSSGAPHFVELAHHQPSSRLSKSIQRKIYTMIPSLLDAVGFSDGASHIELKIDGEQIYLIEINPRGGGDYISNRLVELSTGYDFLGAMIDVALGTFHPSPIKTIAYSGVYFLCEQSSDVLPLFLTDGEGWLVEKKYDQGHLSKATGNYDRNGYLIYKSNHKIIV